MIGFSPVDGRLRTSVFQQDVSRQQSICYIISRYTKRQGRAELVLIGAFVVFPVPVK